MNLVYFRNNQRAMIREQPSSAPKHLGLAAFHIDFDDVRDRATSIRACEGHRRANVVHRALCLRLYVHQYRPGKLVLQAGLMGVYYSRPGHHNRKHLARLHQKESEKMSVQNRLLQLTLVGLSLAIGVYAAQSDEREHKETCSNATLHGSYGLHATGTNISGAFAAVGRLTYDGNGNVTGKLFVNVAGNNSEPELTGTYSVSPDCIVTDNFGGGSHVSVIVDHGKGYYILNNAVGAGATISGEAKKQ
jgi:hypothetical protein